MKSKKVYLSVIDSYWKANQENSEIFVQRISKNFDIVGGDFGIINSSELIQHFDLTEKREIQVQVRIHDIFSTKFHAGSGPVLAVEIEEAPNTYLPIMPGNAYEHLFEPEYSLNRFSRKGIRQTSYVQLFRKLQGKNIHLYFSGILEYKPEPGEHLGCGLIEIRCFIPEFNYLIEALKKINIV